MEYSIILSIIVPVYNGEKYIEKLFNTFQKFDKYVVEMIIIDDGSRDMSWNLMSELPQRDSRIKVYHKENSGIAETRNYGLEKAKGKYVCFWDQDDEIVVAGFEHLIQRMESSDANLCIANSGITVNGKREKKEIIKKNEIAEKVEIDQLIAWLIGTGTLEYGNAPTIGSTIWNCMFRNDYLKDNAINFESFIDYEDDWVFLIRTLKHASKVFLDTMVVYYWTINPSSESHRGKYVLHFYSKRKKLKDFIDKSLATIDITDIQKEKFEIVFQRRTFLWNLYNECYRCASIKEKLINIKTVVEKENGFDKYKLRGKEYSKKENLLLSLLLSHHYLIVYFVNKYIFKFRFH